MPTVATTEVALVELGEVEAEGTRKSTQESKVWLLEFRVRSKCREIAGL